MAEFTAEREVVAPPPLESVTITFSEFEASWLLDILEEYVSLGGCYDITAPQWITNLRNLGVTTKY